MTTKMDEGFKTQENARQLIEKELFLVKDEFKIVKMGSGNAVCSEVSIGSGTCARPPPITSRWSEIIIARKMEFKGCVTDYSRGRIQGITCT